LHLDLLECFFDPALSLYTQLDYFLTSSSPPFYRMVENDFLMKNGSFS
jgi:hypothetical protein